MINNFEELISEGLVLVDFYADWCGPCKMMNPILEKVKSAKIVKVDVDVNEELAREYSVMTIPMLILFKDGKLIDKKNGFVPEPILLKWLEENN